jgi:uncharacterized protein with FMN-binding domain
VRRAIFALAGTVAGLVLLLSFKTHPTTAVTTPPAAIGTTATATTTAAAPTTTTPTTTAAKATAAPKKKTSTAAKTVTGAVVETRYGPVQVRITVKGGKITAAAAVQYPYGDSRSAQISSYAIPTLNQEAVAAGSASIDMVSGASYTSDGYLQSLQSALTAAGLA